MLFIRGEQTEVNGFRGKWGSASIGDKGQRKEGLKYISDMNVHNV